MIDWRNGTWQQGDEVRFSDLKPNQTPQFLVVIPGMYWYSGLGSGTFFRPDGTMLQNCSPQEANAEARRLGITMRYVDSFINVGSFSVA